MSTTQADLTRQEIQEIFRRNRGSQSELARLANVAVQTVNLWLNGKTTSANIAEAAQRFARQLQAKDRSDAA